MLGNKQRGDTLIEVLMAMVVLSVVVAGSYMIANRSMTINRQTQDRSQATKVMETQFERIKYASRQNAAAAGTTGQTAFTSYEAFINNPGDTGCFNDTLEKTEPCLQDAKYTTTVTYFDSPQSDSTGQPLSAANVFKVSVVWDEKGVGDREVTGYYRVFDEPTAGSVAVGGGGGGGGGPVSVNNESCSSSGSVSYSGSYKIHTFRASDTFTSTCPLDIEYLIIGGGGAGGAGNLNEGGGGGGGGGMIAGNASISPGSFNIVVGAGGSSTSDPNAAPQNGSNSIFFGKVALGGGGGASCWVIPGGTGGSGGGGGGCGDAVHSAGSASQPTSSSGGFGNAGGLGQWTGGGANGCSGNGGGGGGAGGAGGSGASRPGGCAPAVGSKGGAGAGRISAVSGSFATYSAGGTGGAGRSDHVGDIGSANTGNGGGGSANGKPSGVGGSGIVILRYINTGTGTVQAPTDITNYNIVAGATQPQSNYTAASWAAYQAALAANAITPQSTQAQIDTATQNIQAAQANLVVLPPPAKPILVHIAAGQYRISNYNSAFTYTLSQTSGSSVRTGDTVTCTGTTSVCGITARNEGPNPSPQATYERTPYTYYDAPYSYWGVTGSYNVTVTDWCGIYPTPDGFGIWCATHEEPRYNFGWISGTTRTKNATPAGWQDSGTDWYRIN